MTREFALKMLSYVPLGTPVGVFMSPDPDQRPVVGAFRGLALRRGEDIIRVQPAGEGVIDLPLDEAVAATIGLR